MMSHEPWGTCADGARLTMGSTGSGMDQPWAAFHPPSGMSSIGPSPMMRTCMNGGNDELLEAGAPGGGHATDSTRGRGCHGKQDGMALREVETPLRGGE